MRREAIYCGRQDDVRACVSLLICINNGEVDVAMDGIWWNGLNLIQIYVRIDSVGGEHALCRRGDDTGAGLRFASEGMIFAQLKKTGAQCV